MIPIGLHPLGTARLRAGLGALDRSFPEELRTQVAEHDLPEDALWLAWELARLAPALSPIERRATILLVLATMIGVRTGSTRLPLPDGSGSAEDQHLAGLLARLRVTAVDARATLELARALAQSIPPACAPIFGGPGEYKPLLVEAGQLYQQRLLRHELRVADVLGARLQAAPLDLAGGAIEAVLAELRAQAPVFAGIEAPLSDEQSAAVRAALTGRLTVISGGPGTGKTSIIVSILRALLRLGVPMEAVALAAPTGKAANRMDESISRALIALPNRSAEEELLLARGGMARTLHRLLGASARSDRWTYHEANPLSESVVLVDECSMVDLFLMDRLARAVRPEARLILLGDADQLPSVDAGAVLRDLLPDEGVATDPRARATHRLTHSYRMRATDRAGQAILAVARLINAGAGEALFEPGADGAPVRERARVEDLRTEGVELLAPGEQGQGLQAYLTRWYAEQVYPDATQAARARKIYRLEGETIDSADQVELAALFAHFEGFRLLCVTRGDGRPTGAESVNLALHRHHGQHTAPGSATGAALLPGEPVMMQRNDYERGLFNGDQGLVLAVREGDGGVHSRAVFPRKGGWAAFHLEALRADLELAYAVTVHKGQGSEFDRVGVILPEAPLPLLTRELLYTAVTRSRRAVTLVGSREVFLAGTRAQLHRYSGIGARLARPS